MKTLTVTAGHSLDRRKNFVAHGKITFQGKWLNELGFLPGKKYLTTYEKGSITLKLITQ